MAALTARLQPHFEQRFSLAMKNSHPAQIVRRAVFCSSLTGSTPAAIPLHSFTTALPSESACLASEGVVNLLRSAANAVSSRCSMPFSTVPAARQAALYPAGLCAATRSRVARGMEIMAYGAASASMSPWVMVLVPERGPQSLALLRSMVPRFTKASGLTPSTERESRMVKMALSQQW